MVFCLGSKPVLRRSCQESHHPCYFISDPVIWQNSSACTVALCQTVAPSHQVRELAAAEGVVLGGENALPCFSPNGVDATALERIVYNTQVASVLLVIRCTCSL